MRAIQFEEYGGPEVLHLAEDVPEPHPGLGQVRIAVRAVAVNPFDWKVRSGAMAEMMPLDLPRIPGSDAAGVVDEVGEGVTGVSVGDAVLGNGAQVTAERAVLDTWVGVPAGLSFEEAAALPQSVETAARVLDLLALEPGQVVVLDGAAGGVGTAAVQLAASRGLVVVGTASERNHDHLRDLGALPTTYGPGLADRVRALVDAPVAGAVDLVGKGSVPALVELTGDPHQVVTIADFSAGDLGVQVTSRATADYALAEVAKLIEEGRFEVVVDEVLDWREAARAHERSQEGHVRGKLVLRVS